MNELVTIFGAIFLLVLIYLAGFTSGLPTKTKGHYNHCLETERHLSEGKIITVCKKEEKRIRIDGVIYRLKEAQGE